MSKSNSFQDWRLIAQNIPELVTITDRKGTILSINRTLSFGDVEEVLGLSIYDFVPPTNREEISASIARAFDTGKACSYTTISVGPDPQKTCWYTTRVIPIVEANVTQSVVLISTDVSDQVLANHKLAESERWLLKAQSLARIGHWRLNPKTGEVDGSAELFSIFGLNDDEATLDAFAAVVHPEDREYDLAHIRRGMETGESWDIEHRLLLSDGTIKVVNAIGDATVDEAGDVVMLMGTVQDITERKMAESRLEAQLAYQTLLSELSSDFINLTEDETESRIEKWLERLSRQFDLERICIAVYSEEHADFEYKYCHAKAGIFNTRGLYICQTLPWYGNELILGNPVILTNCLEELPTDAANERAIWGKEGQVSVLTLPWRTGVKPFGCMSFGAFHHYQWTEETIRQIRLVSDIFANVLIRQQVNDEKTELLNQLHQSQKMLAIGQLAGGIAHDFNNILGGIIGYADMSIDDVASGSVLHQNISQILKGAHRAKQLVAQILTFSRQGEREKKVLEMRPLAQEVLEFLNASIPATIEIQAELAEVPLYIKADPTKIHEALMNLATNAVHAMANKGTLTLRLQEMEITAHEIGKLGDLIAGRYCSIALSDTGHGMNAEVQRRMFEPFFTTKPPGQGTGMGLSVVFGIAQSHGGNIRVESAVGQGTTIQLILPLTAESTAQPSSETPLVIVGKERILFVDDEEVMATMSRELLLSLGYDVIVTQDSYEALGILAKEANSIDLLITDQTMPRMTGIELAEEALKLNPALPIILCTGYSSEVDAKVALSRGITKFCMKPLTKMELGRAIREALESK